MSKSLGNVLDPFEVIEKYGSDALRFYCFREVSFGQDGSISTAGFEARYETELANDFGNLASRVLAMVDRYRDGVVPADAEIDPDLADGEGGLGGVEILAAGLLDRTEISRALEVCWVGGPQAESLRRGAEALGARQGPRSGRRPRSGPLQPGRGPAGRDAAAARLHPALVRHSCWRPSARTRGRSPSFGSRGGGQSVERIPPLFPKLEEAGVIDSHAHLDVCDPPNAELVADARRVGVTRILTVGLDEESNLGAVQAAQGARGRLRGGRPPSELRRRVRRRGRRGDRGARAGGRRQGDRRDRARLLPRPRLRGGPGPRLRGADRDRPADATCRSSSTSATAAARAPGEPSPTATSCWPPRRRASR